MMKSTMARPKTNSRSGAMVRATSAQAPQVHEVLRCPAQHLVEHGNEEGPENRARYAPEPPYDDHCNILHGEEESKGLRRNARDIVSPQAACDPRVEGAYGEREELVLEMGMPIPSAARSLSRMAMNARPNRVRKRFAATHAMRTKQTKTT